MNDPTLLFQFLLGPFLLLTAILLKRFPPRRINTMYGYRTRRSTASQEAWEFANRYSANCLMAGAAALVGVQCILVLLLEPATSLLATAVLVCAVPLAIIPAVERQLRRKFG